MQGEAPSVVTAFNLSVDLVVVLLKIFLSLGASMGRGIDSCGETKVESLLLSVLKARNEGLLKGELWVANLEPKPTGVLEAELETVTTPIPSSGKVENVSSLSDSNPA